MKTFPYKVYVFISGLMLLPSGPGRADEVPIVSSTTVLNSTLPKHHHHRKKPVSDAAIGKSSGTLTQVGIAAGNGAIPGVSHDSQAGSVGSPNMGTPDHTPGTTGTSGQ
jgi:hypothetical protein